MKTNSDAPRTLYIGLDVHKEKTSIAILESDRDAEPRYYGECPMDRTAMPVDDCRRASARLPCPERNHASGTAPVMRHSCCVSGKPA